MIISRPTKSPCRRSLERQGAVLLEVVLALVLFVAAATVISGALGSSFDGVERQRQQLHAANLAITVHSELDMGLRTLEAAGPEAFAPPFEEWTWQLQSESAGGENGSSALLRVEVVVRNTNTTTVHRSAQFHAGKAAAP